MKLKSWLRYFVFALIIFGLIILNAYVLRQFSSIQSKTYTINFFLLSVTSLIYMVLGALLGYEYLITEAEKSGHWKLNLPKFIFLVIPSLYLSLGLVLYFTDLGILYYPVVGLLLNSAKYSLTVMSVSQILFGYFIVTSFYKSGITE
jgi:hypothetical protein